MSRHASPGLPAHRTLVPSRADLIDAGFLFALGLIALVGFRTTYDGWNFLIAGAAGLLLGILLAYLAVALRQPAVLLIAVTVLAFFLLGGAIALRSEAVAGFLPGGRTVHGLAEQSIHGWKDLLTTLPPVDGNGPLLVLPYLIGLVGGALGLFLARRFRFPAVALPVPLGMLVLILLLGDLMPAAKTLHGVVFGLLALTWIAVRHNELRPTVHGGTGQLARAATALGLLAVAGVCAAFVGPHLPGGGDTRTVLRSHVDPPVDIDQYGSPLTVFRKYKIAQKTQVLFTVKGLPDGTPVRIATLDNYDGFVWSASNPGTVDARGVSNSFRRIGSRVTTPVSGKKVDYTVTIAPNGYADVWLPDAGALTSVDFHGSDADAHHDQLRYDLATDTGLVLDGLHPGDSYTVHAVLPDAALPANADPGTVSGDAGAASDFVEQKAGQLAGNADSPLNRLKNVMAAFKAGFYSDGNRQGEEVFVAGHSKYRISGFFAESALVGDDEQYAAALALISNSSFIGVPARVVFGATPKNGQVTGADIHAWVEVQLLDGSWRTIPDSDFMPPEDKHPQLKPKEQQAKTSGQLIPPPAVTHVKTDQSDGGAVDGTVAQQKPPKPPAKKQGLAAVGAWFLTALKWGGPPIAAIVLIALAIVGVKLFRRWRRRSSGPPALRLARGWRDMVDVSRDFGRRVPSGRTRREQAALLHPELAALARAADAHVFGSSPPGEQEAAAYWQQVDSTRRELAKRHGWWRRLRAAVSLASFRRLRPAVESATVEA